MGCWGEYLYLKREAVPGVWIRLHNDQRNLYGEVPVLN
jgi:hypothetical protein